MGKEIYVNLILEAITGTTDKNYLDKIIERYNAKPHVGNNNNTNLDTKNSTQYSQVEDVFTSALKAIRAELEIINFIKGEASAFDTINFDYPSLTGANEISDNLNE